MRHSDWLHREEQCGVVLIDLREHGLSDKRFGQCSTHKIDPTEVAGFPLDLANHLMHFVQPDLSAKRGLSTSISSQWEHLSAAHQARVSCPMHVYPSVIIAAAHDDESIIDGVVAGLSLHVF
jgi:hypothetical protein